nr:hypothetical protein [Mycoplasma haemocanis]
MFASGLSKGILGTSVAVGTGVGLGSAALTSKGDSPFSKTSSSSKIPATPKSCKIYQIQSSATGEVKSITEEAIKTELGQEGIEHYKKIKEACDTAKGGNIFLSKKGDKRYWQYYPEDQDKQTVKQYLEKNPNS